MRTDNLKKLIRSGITAYNPTSSVYSAVLTPINGTFKNVAGNAVASTYTENQSVINTENYAIAIGGAMILQSMVLRSAISSVVPKYKSWSSIANGGKEAAVLGMQTYISVTYDSENQPISSEDYAMRGSSVPATIALQNNGTVTVTISNSGSSVLHANRIGVTAVLCSYGTKSSAYNAEYGLIYIFAFDDIALAPGETKSITIQPDLD